MRYGLMLGLVVACGGSSSSTPTDGGDPDAACVCDSPPPGTCVDGTTLQTYREPGTCTDGTCEYETFTTACPFTCADGACQPEACTPSCPAATCGDDGCGGTCGPCASGTTFPGVTATGLGVAEDLQAAPDGIHLAAIRAYDPIGACPNPPVVERRGKLDVWTVPPTGPATHRTVANGVGMRQLYFTADGHMVFTANGTACALNAELWVAKVDGTEPRRIALAAASVEVAGERVFWVEPGPTAQTSSYFTAALPTGAPVLLATAPFQLSVPAPDGRAMFLLDADARTLTIHRIDGTSTAVVTAPDQLAGVPQWSPDSSKLVFTTVAPQIPFQTVGIINTDGTDKAVLDNECRCGDSTTIAWSRDSARLVWAERPPTFGLDLHVHAFAGGQDVVLTSVITAAAGGTISRLEFSTDNSRILAAGGGRMTMGSPTTSGAMSVLLDGGVGWLESSDATTIAGFTSSNTSVITYGGGTTVVPGAVFGAAYENGSATGRWIFGNTSPGVYAKDGTTLDAPLPGFMTSSFLSDWAQTDQIPFMFGFAGSTVLYPTNVIGTTKVAQDLVAKTAAATGKIGDAVTHYRLGTTPPRIFFTNDTTGLFVLPRP